MLDAPDTSTSRPGLRLRIIALVVLGLFALLGLRLWALTVLQAPAAAQAVNADQIRVVQVAPTRGLILDRYGNPLVNNLVTEQITLSRVTAIQHPEVIGRLAALIGQTTAQVKATSPTPSTACTSRCPVLSNAPLSDILYIKEHQSEFPGVSSVATTQRNYPQRSCPGRPRWATRRPRPSATWAPSTAPSSRPGRPRATRPATPSGSRASSTSTRPSCGAPRASSSWRSTPRARWWAPSRRPRPRPGDNLVTNIDTGLQQVADNALATQILPSARPSTPSATTTPAATRRPPVGRSSSWTPRPAPSTPCRPTRPTTRRCGWEASPTANYAALSNPANNEPLINRAIDGLYTPGSTFKLNTATAALDIGLWISPTTLRRHRHLHRAGLPVQQHDLHPPQQRGRRRLRRDQHLDRPHRVERRLLLQPGRHVLRRPRQPATAQTPIQDQAAQYGLGELTGIDLPGEAPGPGGQPGRAAQAPRR